MRDKFNACTFLYLTRENKATGKTQILLQLRENTGYMDGKYDFATSGHVQSGESMKHTVCREAKEEIGIDILEDNVEFLMLVDAPEEGYLKGFFTAASYSGEPKVCEPDKCGGLLWADLDNLPENIIPYLPAVISCIHKGIHYAISSSLIQN